MASYSQSSVNELLTDEFTFNCKKHIIDLSDLVGQVSGLRLTAQERVLAEFKHILGEVDAYISFSSESIPAPTAITSNLQQIALPDAVYVAELTIDEKDVVKRAKAELKYRGKARSMRSIVKMALLLNGEGSDAWVCHDGRLFSFYDIEQCGLRSVVDAGSIERLGTSDLTDPAQPDNVNILKQLLFAETQERFKKHHVRTHPKDRFFFFAPKTEGDRERKESWVGKKKSIRRVYELKYQKKDPTKVAHHQHLSFDLSFTQFGDDWCVVIVPSWYYSYDGYIRSNWHDDLLAQQKRLEFNLTVRNLVRFLAYFLTTTDEGDTCGLRYGPLIEFNAKDNDDDDLADDDDPNIVGEAAA